MSRLPTFVVIGAMRAGTTSLYAHFREHPEIFVSPEKETDYFSLGDLRKDEPPRERPRRASTLSAYQESFRGSSWAKARGEASPSYLFHGLRSAPRMSAIIPEAKLICVLRDPIDRAYSHFGLNRKFGLEPLADFESAIAAEREPERAGMQRFAYLGASRYHEDLRAFASRFPPAQLRVLRFEEFRRDPAATMRQLYDFIGVDPGFVPDVAVRHNRSGEHRASLLRQALRRMPRLRRAVLRRLSPRLGSRFADLVLHPQPPLAREVRRRLLEGFSDEVRGLERLLGWDLSAWRAD